MSEWDNQFRTAGRWMFALVGAVTALAFCLGLYFAK